MFNATVVPILYSYYQQYHDGSKIHITPDTEDICFFVISKDVLLGLMRCDKKFSKLKI